jgi:hypothetical protein
MLSDIKLADQFKLKREELAIVRSIYAPKMWNVLTRYKEPRNDSNIFRSLHSTTLQVWNLKSINTAELSKQ